MANKSKKKKEIKLPKFKKKTKLMLLVLTCVATLLVISTYAWFSASLNVKVKFINMKVATDNGLFISLDGVNWSDEVVVSQESIMEDINDLYPNHLNQWSTAGLWTVSTNGIKNPNSDKFEIYYGEVIKYRDKERKGQYYLQTTLVPETTRSDFSNFIAFDMFLKNVSGSPNKDNLYLTEFTTFDFAENVSDETKENMTGIMNSIRLGIVKIGETTLDATPQQIQNLTCNNNCMSLIYEPFSTEHIEKSINDAQKLGITIEDGQYFPTYGIISEGTFLNHKSCYYNTNVAIDEEHFQLQQTLLKEDLEDPIFQIPNGIVKCRVYVWLEGQDIDSLETRSEGAPIDIVIDFVKDLAGYDEFN